MSAKFRRPVLAPTQEEEAFISQAKTAGQGRAPSLPKATPALPPELNPRVMRQLNIEIPETFHYEIRQVVDTIPKMSVRRFIIEAITEKLASVRAGQGA